nr:MAG TPA: hypothetical protein [Caudoviricetes sp.]
MSNTIINTTEHDISPLKLQPTSTFSPITSK